MRSLDEERRLPEVQVHQFERRTDQCASLLIARFGLRILRTTSIHAMGKFEAILGAAPSLDVGRHRRTRLPASAQDPPGSSTIMTFDDIHAQSRNSHGSETLCMQLKSVSNQLMGFVVLTRCSVVLLACSPATGHALLVNDWPHAQSRELHLRQPWEAHLAEQLAPSFTT